MKYVLNQYITMAKTKGFTLLEVMMVITIMAVLLTLVTPSVVSMIDKQRVRGTCESIYQNLAIARSSSVSLNKNVFFNFRSSNAGATWCVGVHDGSACNCSAAPAACTVNSIAQTARSTDFGGGSSSIKATLTDGMPNTSVTYSARDAAPTTTPPDVRVNSKYWACGVHVEPLGQVRLLKTGSGDSIKTVVSIAESGGLY